MPKHEAAQRPLGLVAGNGPLPLQFSRAVRAQGRPVVAVGLREEADRRLSDEVDALSWRHVGQLGGIVRVFTAAGVTEACLLGGVRKRHWLRYGRPDATALRLLWSLARREDDALLRAIASSFERRGVRIVESLPWLSQTLVGPGGLGAHSLSPRQTTDVAYGVSVCRALGRADIGQCVAVYGQSVLAVEAMEGTDACIARAGALSPSAGFVVVKLSKPDQDMRFDVPTVGPSTIAAMRRAGASALVVEAERVMVIEPERTLRAADAAGIVVYGCKLAHCAQEETSRAVPAL